MNTVAVKSATSCAWDELSLGEIMLRFDPGEGRIKSARSFRVSEGGGEYNVARGLRRCFGMRTAVATAIPKTDVGLLLEDLILQGGVDLKFAKWVDYDGFGRRNRVGLNFTERGFGVRGALGVSDRAHSAASGLRVGDIEWDSIFGDEGVRWFHCGGIFAALSATSPDVVMEAMQSAQKNGTVVSYDLNYRTSLWESNGGKVRAQEINRKIATLVDVMIGNEEDFTAALGFGVEGMDENITGLDSSKFKAMINEAVTEFPNFAAVATTLREVHTATSNDWGAILYTGGEFYEAQHRERLEILDRVGGGDSFASGLIYGLLSGLKPQECIDYGAAHGALAMTTPGDTSMASLAEVERLVTGGSARVIR